MVDLGGLPGGERAARGLRDLAEGRTSCDALWLAIASRRLRDLGLELPPTAGLPNERELALYDQLCRTVEDPYYAYGGLLGELDSFVSALEARRRWGPAGAPATRDPGLADVKGRDSA